MTKKFTCLAAIAIFIPSLFAQPVLVKDLNPGASDGFDEYNYNGITFNNAFLLPGNDGVSGQELYQLKNGSLTLLKDINPGAGNSKPAQFYQSNGKVYFSAAATGGQSTLWQTDGTPDGTVEVTATAALPFVELVMDKNGVFYFISNNKVCYFDPASGNAAQLTGGPGDASFEPDYNSTGALVCRYGNGIVFGIAGNDNLDFWKAEGAGISKIHSLTSPGFFTKLYGLTPLGDNFLFTVSNSVYPSANGLYVYNTANNNSTRIVDASGSESLIPRRIAAFSDTKVIFMDASKIYATDGTAAGTVLLHNNVPSLFSGAVWNISLFNGKMLFEGEESGFQTKIYATDGTPAGTSLSATTEDPFISPMFNYLGNVWWAGGTSNGFYPTIWHTSLQTLNSNKVYSYTSGSPIKSVIPITLQGNKLYYLSNMGGAGREMYSLNVSQSTGVKDIVDSPYQLARTGNTFRIETGGGDQEILKAFVYHTDGRLARQIDIRTGENVALPGLTTGTYFIRIAGSKGGFSFQHFYTH